MLHFQEHQILVTFIQVKSINNKKKNIGYIKNLMYFCKKKIILTKKIKKK